MNNVGAVFFGTDDDPGTGILLSSTSPSLGIPTTAPDGSDHGSEHADDDAVDYASYMEESNERASRVPHSANVIFKSLRDYNFMDTYSAGYYSSDDLELIVTRSWIQAIVMAMTAGFPMLMLGIFTGVVLGYFVALVAAIVAGL